MRRVDRLRQRGLVQPGHLIVHSALDVQARVPGLDEAGFAQAVDAAHEGCSFSALLRDAGVEIEITTTLEGGD